MLSAHGARCGLSPAGLVMHRLATSPVSVDIPDLQACGAGQSLSLLQGRSVPGSGRQFLYVITPPMPSLICA
jgi:hypothetical protein